MARSLVCLAAAAALTLTGGLAAGAAPAAAQTPVAGEAGPETELAPVGVCLGAEDGTAPAPVQLAAMRCLVNYARAQHGLKRLGGSRRLARSAAAKTAMMLTCDQFAHDACGRPWFQVLRAVGLRRSVGENIAYANYQSADGTLASPRFVMDKWLHSPSHRTNILRTRWRTHDVAVHLRAGFQGLGDVAVWTSHFSA